MEVHQVLHGLHLMEHILGQELGQRRLLLARVFVKDNNKAAYLLQVLYFRADQVFVSLDNLI